MRGGGVLTPPDPPVDPPLTIRIPVSTHPSAYDQRVTDILQNRINGLKSGLGFMFKHCNNLKTKLANKTAEMNAVLNHVRRSRGQYQQIIKQYSSSPDGREIVGKLRDVMQNYKRRVSRDITTVKQLVEDYQARTQISLDLCQAHDCYKHDKTRDNYEKLEQIIKEWISRYIDNYSAELSCETLNVLSGSNDSSYETWHSNATNNRNAVTSDPEYTAADDMESTYNIRRETTV